MCPRFRRGLSSSQINEIVEEFTWNFESLSIFNALQQGLIRDLVRSSTLDVSKHCPFRIIYVYNSGLLFDNTDLELCRPDRVNNKCKRWTEVPRNKLST